MVNYFQTYTGTLIPLAHIDYLSDCNQGVKSNGILVILKSGREIWLPEEHKENILKAYKGWLDNAPLRSQNVNLNYSKNITDQPFDI